MKLVVPPPSGLSREGWRAWLPLLLCLTACGRSVAPTPNVADSYPPPEWQPVLTQRLAEFQDEGLPPLDEADTLDIQDLLLLSQENGRNGSRARQGLADLAPELVTAACLTLVETHNMDLETRLAAYAWMRGHAPIAVLPRLSLRLKYEKDWPANVDIARTLLHYGSGAGLDALIAILQAESGGERIELARFLAMEALAELPTADSTKRDGFEANWQHLLALQSQWARWRRLPAADNVANSPTDLAPRPLRAEMWRMAARLRSQPLRPVDDARFVFVRLPRSAFPLLLETTRDQDRYVREHALQTLEWIGHPVGRWAQEHPELVLPPLLALRGDPLLRPRLFGALGAMGLPELAPEILPWLRDGNLEESTAAADALLRCADQSSLRALQAAQASLQEQFSPEARYSLELLLAQLEEQDIEQLTVPPELDPSEAERRRQWALARADRP